MKDLQEFQMEQDHWTVIICHMSTLICRPSSSRPIAYIKSQHLSKIGLGQDLRKYSSPFNVGSDKSFTK